MITFDTSASVHSINRDSETEFLPAINKGGGGAYTCNPRVKDMHHVIHDDVILIT